MTKLRAMPRPRLSSLLVCLFACLFGASCLWRISEQDIYWQIRAGDDLLRTGVFPHVDTWSYSVRGEPWLNIQWLSTLLFRGVYGLGGDSALVVTRGMLVALFFAVLGITVARAAQSSASDTSEDSSEWLSCAAVATLLPLAYLASAARLQIRSDLLVFIVAAMLAWVWVAVASHKVRCWATLGLIVLAANLHAGTAPFVVAQGVACLVAASDTPRKALLWCGTAVAAFFVTPYHINVLPILWAHIDYSHHNILPNPDHTPFTAATLRTRAGLWMSIGWFALCGASIMAWLRTVATYRAPHPAHRRAFVTGGLWLLFFFASLDRARAIPYHTVVMLPLVASSLPLWRMSRSAYAAVSLALSALAASCIDDTRRLWGFGINDAIFPVGSARFIQANRPRGNIMHTFAYGAYTVWHLRNYPTYVDTRETPFWRLQPEVLAAYHSAEETQALARKYDVNTMLMPIPKTRYVQGVGFEDVLARYLPDSDWALVYFDRLSTVMVRRVPEHAALIEAHAYRILRPNLPANLYPVRGPHTHEQDARFVTEVNRCLVEEPEQAYCLIAQATWWRVQGELPRANDAIAYLERARRSVGPDSPQFPTLMVELENAYRFAEEPQQAEAIGAILGPGALVQEP